MTYRLLINGELVDGASTLDVVNPATGAVFERAARADEAQLNAAITAAKAAFPAWAALSYAERGSKLGALADALEARLEEFSILLTAEQGKPAQEAQIEIYGTIAILRHFASQVIEVETLKEDPSGRILRQRTPLGVVAAVVPWNYPLLLLAVKLGPALITGNTVVAKPAPTTPLTTLLLGELAAGIFPPGVLATIVDSNDLGSLLTGHPDVAKIGFTGSTGTGMKVMQAAASTLKRLTLELGGNDAAIVLDDVDVKTVAPLVFAAATVNAGQLCMAAKRIYVHASIYDTFCDEMAKLARETVVGDGAEQGTQMGPIQNPLQFEKVKAYLEEARTRGTVIAGGEALDGPGYFIEPTVVRDIPDDARLVREEQFGPIVPIMSYETVEEAIARANDDELGLAGTIWTANPERGAEIALRVEAGTVWVNKHFDFDFNVSNGGAKRSGFGVEFGPEGLHEYTQPKVINIAL